MTEWRKVKLGDILDFYNGKAIKSSSGIIPIYGANGIIGRTNRSLYNNAIIIGRVGAYCGSVALCEKDFWASDNTIVTKPKDDNNTLFFYYLLDTMDLNKYAGGSAQPLLTQSTLKSLETYIPCANVQQRIAEVLSRYDALIENYQRQIKLLEEAAQRLYKDNDSTKNGSLTYASPATNPPPSSTTSPNPGKRKKSLIFLISNMEKTIKN